MPFLNPFRKNNRSEGVKLAAMTSDADPREVSPSTVSERREPSFGSSGNLAGEGAKLSSNAPMEPIFKSTPEPAFEQVKPANTQANSFGSVATNEVPPAFTFSDSERVPQFKPFEGATPKLNDAFTGNTPLKATNGTSTTATPPAASWDPYGMGMPAKQSASPNPFSAEPPSLTEGTEPAIPKVPTMPEAPVMASTNTPMERSVGASSSPSEGMGGVKQAQGRDEDASTTPSASQGSEVIKPVEPTISAPVERPERKASAETEQDVQEPQERTQTAEEKVAQTPKRLFKGLGGAATAPRRLTRTELEARTRSRHRYVGTAALLMALVVAAPFMLDKSEEIDNRPFADERMDIPRESETSTAINPVPIDKKPISGDVDVSDMTLGKTSSTAKANLAREADLPTKPSRTTKPVIEKPVPPKKDVVTANPKVETPLKTTGITPPMGSGWYVQVLATGSEEGAERVVRRMTALGLSAYRVKEGGNLWKVRAGLYGSKKEAESAQATIILNGVAQKPYVRKQ